MTAEGPSIQSPRYAPGDLLTVPQALRILPVGKSTIYDLIGQGLLPSVRVTSVGSRRGRVLLLRRGIEDYIDRLRAAPAERPPVRVDVDTLRAKILGRGRGRAEDYIVDNESIPA